MNNQTIAQFLGATTFPFTIKNDRNEIIYSEAGDGNWCKFHRDENGRVTRYENSDGFWKIQEFNEIGERVYFENSDGYIEDNRIVELSLDDIASKFNIPVALLKIKN